MRKEFHHFFRPTDADLNALWTEGLFSFDASVLLNVYGYSRETSEELVSVLENIAPRAYIPYQFGHEYCRNRSVVILRQVANYLKVEKSLAQINSADLAPKRDHPFLSAASMDAFKNIQKELEDRRKEMEKLIGMDPLSERILKVFEGRVGRAPTAAELNQIHSEAQTRFDKLIPPGYADLKEKGVPDAYGDYIGWKQLIAIAIEQKRGVILVTDDFKEDWWRIERERTIAPRPELLAEFAETAQQPFYMYTSENFLRAAITYLQANVGKDALDEVSQRLASQKLEQRPSNQKNIAQKATGTTLESAMPPSTDKITSEIKDTDSSGLKADTQEEDIKMSEKVEDSHGS